MEMILFQISRITIDLNLKCNFLEDFTIPCQLSSSGTHLTKMRRVIHQYMFTNSWFFYYDMFSKYNKEFFNVI